MPLYDYECDTCGGIFEQLSTGDTSCPSCGGSSKRLLSAPSVIRVSGSPVSFSKKIGGRLEKATEERRIAEKASKTGKEPYSFKELEQTD